MHAELRIEGEDASSLAADLTAQSRNRRGPH
jgi:hypothetical protein